MNLKIMRALTWRLQCPRVLQVYSTNSLAALHNLSVCNLCTVELVSTPLLVFLCSFDTSRRPQSILAIAHETL